MVTEEKFKNLLNKYFEFDKFIDDAEKLGLIQFESFAFEYPSILFDMIINEWFNEEGADIINWWLFESEYGDKKIYDEYNNETEINNIDDLWNYVKNMTEPTEKKN